MTTITSPQALPLVDGRPPDVALIPQELQPNLFTAAVAMGLQHAPVMELGSDRLAHRWSWYINVWAICFAMLDCRASQLLAKLFNCLHSKLQGLQLCFALPWTVNRWCCLPSISHTPSMCSAKNTSQVPQHKTLPCRDVVVALLKKLPVLFDRAEGLPATLAERYAGTSKEVQNQLCENVSTFVDLRMFRLQPKPLSGWLMASPQVLDL